MTHSIKFSHHYPKLQALGKADAATLLDVLNVRLEDLSPVFKEYDTRHDGGHYELPEKGDFLLLLFRGQEGMFPTLRRRTPEKERYYRSLIGSTLSVVVP